MTDTTRESVRRSVAWVYQGIWGVLARWFRVPIEPPTLPAMGGHPPVSMRPADGFLTYQRVLFAAGWLAPAGATLAGLVALNVTLPLVGVLISAPILILLGLALCVSWVGIHLRFDTQWYVLTDRSVRTRSGIWVITENTITFENVQDITVLQGPLQRYLGISDIVLETAGGTTMSTQHGQHTTANSGCLQGIADAVAVKEMVAARVRQSRSAGLGDEHRESSSPRSDGHAALLREILAELRGATP